MYLIKEKIDGTYEILLTRGDTLILEIGMVKGDKPFEPEAGQIEFKMKGTYNAENAILEKRIPLETMELEIEPNDTKLLPFGGRYAFGITYTDEQGHVDTFIKGILEIEEGTN